MAKMLQISLICKGPGTSRHNQVDKIGGIVPGEPGELWQVSQRTAIMGIEAGSCEFHLKKRGKPVKVVVIQTMFGNKYLAAETDKGDENSLLFLPEM